MQTEIADE